jgi:hypothetical protein
MCPTFPLPGVLGQSDFMRHESRIAIQLNESIAAVRLGQDATRLQQAPAADLLRAAGLLAKALVLAAESGGL